MPFPDAYDPNDPYAYLGATAGSYEQPTQPGTDVASGGWLPWAQDSYASQAGYAVESPEWNRVWALEQQYRNSPELYGGQSFFDYLGSRDPELAQAIRNPATEAYDQRMRLLAGQGAQRVQNLQNYERDRNGTPLIAYPMFAAAGAGALAELGLAGGGAATGAGAGSGGATTYPLTTGPLASGAGPITATPIAAGGAAGAAGTAGGVGAAGNALGNNMHIPEWVGNYLVPGINTVIGANAANNATDAAVAGNQAAIDESKRQFDTTRADLAPWMTAGKDALGRLTDPNAFAASPDYAFRRDEGTRGIQNLAAAKGTLKSGNALKALAEFNSNLAGSEFNNWFNRQAGIAGVGQNTAVNLGNFGADTAARSGNYMAGIGDARASGVLGRNAALIGGINQGYRNYLYGRP